MKRITILAIFVILVQFTFAQKNVIKTTPFGFVYGKYNLQYQRMLTDYSSASASFSYMRPNIPNLDLVTDYLDEIGIETSFGGYACKFDYRMFSRKKPGPRGFYIGPYIRYTHFGSSAELTDLLEPIDPSIKSIKTGFAFSRTGIGVKLGAQWLIANHFTIDWNFFGLGADYYLLKVYSEDVTTKGGNNYSTQDVEKKGFFLPGISSELSIGYAF